MRYLNVDQKENFAIKYQSSIKTNLPCYILKKMTKKIYYTSSINYKI